jgi:hypothetical protein
MHDANFPHRQNPDGTWDAICPHCFVNAAKSDREEDLDEIEKTHICGPHSRSVCGANSSMKLS